MTSQALFLCFMLGIAIWAHALVDEERFIVSSRSSLPPGFVFHTEAPTTSDKVSFTIFLKQRNLEKLDEIFHQVSNPKSQKWGQFLSKSQLDDLVRPDAAAFVEVKRWLSSASAPVNYEIRADSVKVVTTVGTASQLLRAEFFAVQHVASERLLMRHMNEASVPVSVAPYVDFVAGISEMFGPDDVRPHLSQPKTAAGPDASDILITPPVLRSYYNVPEGLVVTNNTNLQGIAAFSDYFSTGALAAFESDQGLSAANVTVFGQDCLPNCDQGESDLDVQYVTAMARNISTLFINQNPNYWILEFTEEALQMDPIPYVFSISYGWSGDAQCQIAVNNCKKYGYDSEAYVNRVNVDFQKLGVLGVSVMVSDGDDGAPSLGGASGNCPLDDDTYCPLGGCAHKTSKCASFTVRNESSGDLCFFPMGLGSLNCTNFLNDPNLNNMLGDFVNGNPACNLNIENDKDQNPHFYSACTCTEIRAVSSNGYRFEQYVFNENNGYIFAPDYPTSSPWVTSVGATQFKSPDGKTVSSEIAASILTGAAISTGGGFSHFQPMPAYQTKAVQQYLNAADNKLPPSFGFNTSNRAYPDVSFNGHNYKIFIASSGGDQCPCQAIPVDGTSCSSPAFSGLVSLINDQLLNNGKTPLGFLNYLLYQMYEEAPQTLHDISSGNNRCNRAYCCKYGYSAVKGSWDPISGLGSPNFQVRWSC
eukprot:TRINITY_DN361_c0_g1_i1.p1 TRINITY_DN361_c0_g1~~TRINITY_DN361_c0_g1_i1.p1  ORF type:complete len:703 (+),score=220.70 TRINITY_DN361_c0_g1_i1:849-2957(+)